MERMENKVTDQEAVEALNKLSVYCEEKRCSKCMFSRNDGKYCIFGLYHPYEIRVIKTNGELRGVAEWEAINNE